MASRRSSMRKSLSTRFSTDERQLLQIALGDDCQSEGWFSAIGDDCCDFEAFESIPNSPMAEESNRRLTRRFFAISGDDSDDDDRQVKQRSSDSSPCIEDMYEKMQTFRHTLFEFADQEDDDKEDICDIFDQYCFDLDRVALALKEGASLEELVQVFEEGFAESLEQRLPAALEAQRTASLARQCSTHITGEMNGPAMGEDVTGLMTPPEGSEKARLNAADLVSCLRQSMARFRRSSVADCPTLMAAVNDASTRHRRSLAQAAIDLQRMPADPSRLRQSLVAANKHHRLSLIKAAEVLEAAGVGVGSSSFPSDAAAATEVESQLQMVQRAMETARRRHRLSVVKAVEDLKGTSEPSVLPANLEKKCAAFPRVQQAVVAAYAKQNAAKLTGSKKALMNTQIGGVTGKPAHFVHCGPVWAPSTPNPPCRAVRGTVRRKR